MANNRLAVSAWPLRRKLALALAVPMLLAAVFGGLRVQSELDQAANHTTSASQVTVLSPAVAYLSRAEEAVVVARTKGVPVEERDAAIAKVDAAAVELEEARQTANLTPAQAESIDTLLRLSSQLRNEEAYVSIGQSVSQIRQLHRSVTVLIGSVANAQLQPNPRLELLDHALDGRLSLSMQQLQVAYGSATAANPVELASEVGVEAAAIDRLGVGLGAQTSSSMLVLELKQQNALHFGIVKSALDTALEQSQAGEAPRGGDLDLGDGEAFQPYDELTGEFFTAIDADLSAAASEARTLAIVNSVVTGLALLAALILAFLVSRWLLNPIRKVREGALAVANDKLPAAVAKIRQGGDPGDIEPIDVTTQEEMGQLARAVDDLHRQAVRLASGEAALRSQVSDMFVTLSRRNTGLVNQQLALIEGLERDEEDPKRLENLFKLDHLASRMRRTAESLMVLADTPAQGGAADTLTVSDALHAATAGVADYQRVQILSTPGDRIVPIAAGDVVHMVTELLDNALAYSPPTAPVLVMTTTTITATTVRITDSGLGIDHDAMSDLNNVLKSGGEVNAETARRMGLLVVSRLARRHGITVSLERTERGGVTATVVIPRNLLRRGDEAEDLEPRKPAPPAAASATPYKQRVSDASETSAGSGPAAVAEPAAEVDPIEAAINAVIGLPQRRPGATGAGTLAATDNQGGSLLERKGPGEDRPGAGRPVSERPGAERFFLGARKEPLAALGAGTGDAAKTADEARVAEQTPGDESRSTAVVESEVVESQLTAHSVDADDSEEEQESEGAQIFALPSRSPFERPVRGEEPVSEESDATDHTDDSEADDSDTGDGEAGEHAVEADQTDDVAPEPERSAGPMPGGNVAAADIWAALAADDEPAEEEPVAVDQPVTVARPVTSPAPALPTRTPAASALDAGTPMADIGHDDSPIFRSLRSNWLSSGDAEQPWADSEVEAGWQTADRVAEAAPLQRSDSGLPIRRPGGRLVPGGVAPAAKPVVRDPEAIRARLSAHRAGVARGRTAATPGTSTTPSAGPDANGAETSDSHDSPQKEAGLV